MNVSARRLGSKAAYAAHRGCAKSAVTKAIAEGRIAAAVQPDGQVDFGYADFLWAQNTRARVAATRASATAPTSARAPGGRRESAAAVQVSTPSPGQSPDPLQAVEELGRAAHAALARGAFETFAPLLRQAMADVPPSRRARVTLSVEVWDALTATIPLVVDPSAAQAAAGDLDDDVMGQFWYQVALGPELADNIFIRDQAAT